MIYDSIENYKFYENLTKRMKLAFNYLLNTDFTKLSAGKYEVDKSFVYVMVNEYHTIPVHEAKWECHKKYIDIQLIIEGHEQMGFANTNTLKNTIEYNDEKDVAFFEGTGSFVKVENNFFTIFFPHDAHAPNLFYDGKSELVKKVVVKVMVD